MVSSYDSAMVTEYTRLLTPLSIDDQAVLGF